MTSDGFKSPCSLHTPPAPATRPSLSHRVRAYPWRRPPPEEEAALLSASASTRVRTLLPRRLRLSQVEGGSFLALALPLLLRTSTDLEMGFQPDL